MADLLLLYPDRASLPRQIEEAHDVTELAFTEIRILRETVAVLKRTLFGQSSERMKKEDNDKTVMTAEDVPAENADTPTSTDETQPQIEIAPHKRRKPRNRNNDNYHHHGRNPFPKHLPRERVEYDLG
jgi:hypothetical protein